MAKNEWLRSRYDSALKHFAEGWALAREVNDPRLLHSATTFSAFFLFWQGRFREAVRMYEKAVPDIERYPQGGFPLLAVMTVGYCYAQIGQVTQGLGMLDALRNHGLGKGDLYLAAYTEGNIGNVMLEIGRVDEAIQYLEDSAKMAKRAHNDWVWITGKMSLAYAYYLKGDTEQSLQNLREFLHHTRKVHTTVYLYPYLLELCAAMERGEIPVSEGLCLDKDIQGMICGHNVFLKGVAYRFQAQQWEREGRPREDGSVSPGLHCQPEESGQQIELANRGWSWPASTGRRRQGSGQGTHRHGHGNPGRVQ